MKKLLAILLLLVGQSFGQYISYGFNPGPSLVAPSIVQIAGCGGVSGAITCTLSAVANGNSVGVWGLGNSSSCTTATGTGLFFKLWQFVSVGGSNRNSLLFAVNSTGSATTVTLNCTGTNSGAVIFELLAQSGDVVAVDAIGSGTGTGGTPLATTTNAVGASVEEVLADIYDNSNFVTFAAGTSPAYTIKQKVNNSSHAANCTTTCLIAAEEINTKTGLSGQISANLTGIGSDPWNMGVATFVNTLAQDNADTIVTFEGLTNGSNPTVAQLNSSTYGIPVTWSIASAGSVFTGSTSAPLALVNTHQIGPIAYQSGQTLGLSYALGGGSTTFHLIATFPITYPTFSDLTTYSSSIPQNDTALNAYTLNQLNDTSGGADYVAPQLQSTGSQTIMAEECKGGPGSSASAVSAFSGTSGTLTFTAPNSYVSGELVTLSAFAGGNTGLNTQVVTVLSAGLSSTQFEATVTGSGYSSGTGTATTASVPISTSTKYALDVMATNGVANSITSFTGTSGTLTFTNSGNNQLNAGNLVIMSAFAGGNTGLNGQVLTVLAAGLTSTTFEAIVIGSGYSSGTGTATPQHSLRVKNSSGVQIGPTFGCTTQTGPLTWASIGIGINGAEPVATGQTISMDNIMWSILGLEINP